jgi:sugar phosphate isomerase/epimerase
MPKTQEISALSWTWATTGYSFAGWPDAKIIRLCRHAGLSGIEWNAERCAGKSDADLVRIRRAYRAAELKLDSFHLPMNPEDDVASFYETFRRATVERFLRLLEQAARLGCRVVILHPSTNRLSTKTEGLDWYLRQLDKSLRTLLPRAASLRLAIALENMLPGERGGRLGSSPAHFVRFRRAFDHSALGFCLDTGHALVAGGPMGPAAFFDAMAPRLIAFHLADNAGDRDSHLAPGHGLVDWKAVFSRLHRLGYRHPACIETPPFAHGPNASYSLTAWRKMVADTAALAAKAHP